ncbi:S-type pyocin domain-containing protein [Pantoea sp. LMR881]|uniref:S-type pyocin domain-containing protein n=1 Tax=Pantoea sp. LMR881 TaxID=3014336 RepID=UPI0022B02521|nr:colicin D domain-containing protein [Pantoea sp. LMR881]MCZ4061273.1 S-type pyocin domain-containing protein [Pantoea sp. LMR881]
MSGNGGDNAHNNAFGGGGRGPTGGVNTGSGSSGNAGRGNGYWSMDGVKPGPISYDSTGHPIISINDGPHWVNDDSLYGSNGNAGNGNVRTSGTAKITNGYRAVVNGYVYTVTVDGNNNITSVSLYSRPASSSRINWKNGEESRKNSARAQVQAQLDIVKAAAAAAAKKAAEEAAAAEAKRKAEEEAKRKQAEWDAAHPVEAAQRDVNNATNTINASQPRVNSDSSQISNNNSAIASKQARVNQLQAELATYEKTYNLMESVAELRRAHELYVRLMAPRYNERDALQSEIITLQSQNTSLNNDLNTQRAILNKAQSDLASANQRLSKAQADAEAKRKAEAARQAAEEARVKAEQEAAAKAKAAAEAKAKAAAEAATKAAAIEAAKSRLEEPNVFSVSALAAAMGTSTTPMAFAETGLGSISLSGAAATAAWSFVRSVVSELLGIAAVGTGMGALIAAIGYIPGAGEGSDQVPGRNNINMFSTVLDPAVLNLPDDNALKAALNKGGTVTSSIRGRVFYDNDQFNTELVRTEKPTSIRVVKAVKDAVTGLYGYTVPATDTLPSRTILVSPATVPGAGGLPPLVNPVNHVVGGTNTGNPNVPDIDLKVTSYPLSDEPDFNDFILVFEELNLKPMYVMLQDSLDDGIYTRKQLDRKYKHAPDFGISDTKKNRETLTKFRDAIDAHLEDPSTVEKGTYALVEGSKVYFNPKNLRVVVLDKDGMFISGWVLDPFKTNQYDFYIKTGKLR